MVRAHQPGQAAFRSILPEDIDWEAVSGISAFGTPCRRCQLSEPGPYTIRVEVPSGVKLMPHRHPEDRVYTVISGVFYIGLGDQFDGDKVKASGQSLVSASRRSRPLVRLASNTCRIGQIGPRRTRTIHCCCHLRCPFIPRQALAPT